MLYMLLHNEDKLNNRGLWPERLSDKLVKAGMFGVGESVSSNTDARVAQGLLLNQQIQREGR